MPLVRSLSKEDKYEAARTETTLAIAKWIKVDLIKCINVKNGLPAIDILRVQEHPRATQAQTQEEVARQIELFKQKIETF